MLYGRLSVMVVRTLAFVIVRRILGLVGLGPGPDAKDVEIAVLRHQLMVMRRQVARPRNTPQDRLVLAMLARLLPRDRWPAFLVTPSTLLRWHRELVARRWTYPPTGRHRGCLPVEVVELVARMARANPAGVCAHRGGVPEARGARVGDLGAYRRRVGPRPAHRAGPRGGGAVPRQPAAGAA